ncbi:MAG: glycosyltransferase family 2 protein [Planctomycetota bacterium]|nr:glycosyltransferase family 2 protein [Planctomycetota bacterium]
MDASVIIVNWNTRDLVLDCIRSVVACKEGCDVEIVVVDNGSTDGSCASIRREFPDVRLIANDCNLGFARAVNMGIRSAAGRHLVLLNSDARLRPGALKGAIAYLDENEHVGAVGAQLLNPDGSRQTSFDNFPTLASELINKSLLRALLPHRFPSKKQEFSGPVRVESIIGAFMAVPRRVAERVGPLDESFFFFLEETDWCFRIARAGYDVVHAPHLLVEHLQGQSKSSVQTEAKIEYLRSLYRFFKKNRRPVSYLVLRLAKPLKYFFAFFVLLLASVFTLLAVPSLRARLVGSFRILRWHLMICPSSAGLSGVRRENP